MAGAPTGPAVFAYDGSDTAKEAIAEAANQLSPGREVLVVTVWQPFNVGFVAPRELEMDAAAAADVRAAAEQTAAQGAALAQSAGFDAKSMEKEGAPTWKGIIEVAEEKDASLIVVGSHGRSGFAFVLIGSVAEAVAAHSHRPVLLVRRHHH